MTRRYSDMNQHDALYKVARAYPGGLEALAAAMKMSVNVLRNKLAPGIETHYPSFEEVSEIVALCQEAGMKDAFADSRDVSGTAWRVFGAWSQRVHG